MLRYTLIIVLLFFIACNSHLKTDLTTEKSKPEKGYETVPEGVPWVPMPGTVINGKKATKEFRPGQANNLQFDEAVINLDGNEISQKTIIGIEYLNSAELPALEPGMTNVTKGPRKGYRFTPSPNTFLDNVQVTLPYDKVLIPQGLSENDVRTFYYDTTTQHWQALDRAAINTAGQFITSDSNHFTDMINATVTVPDHPELQTFNPTQIKDIKAADPGTGINLIEPPHANNTGDARLSYAIEVPPGRSGLQPQLSVSYNSSGGNGWLGLGWDLSTPVVSVDTRWGVPRYSASQETETYTLNGEQLTPVAHRGLLQPRTAEKVFHTRVEGGFRRIVRHGDNPTNYTWEVTEKNGTVHTYGTIDPATQVLTDGAGNRFLWALCETRDTNGNMMRYRYTRVNDTGVTGGVVPGTNIYLSSINYTGFAGVDGAYNVTFSRDRDLGEGRRADVQIDARGGFKRVTADLLRRVTVTFSGQLVRYYDLRYNENAYGDGRPGIAFNKTLLTSINQYTKDSTLFNSHKLTYFDEARTGGGSYNGFLPTASWNVGSDSVSAGLLGEGAASAIGGSKSSTIGGQFYFGGGFNDFLLFSKTLTGGFHMQFSSTKSETLISMTDINGDGLPDKVFKGSDGIYYRPNLANPFGQTGYGSPVKIGALSRIGKDSTTSTTAGAQLNFGIAATFDINDSITQSDTYLTDVNGDGLVDLVDGGQVRFGYVTTNGAINFSANSADTPVAIGSGAIDTSNLLSNMGALEAQRAANFPLLDSVREWVAPYSGTVQITGDAQLIQNFSPDRAQNTQVDGVRTAIQLENSELASVAIGPNDYSSHSFANVSAIAVNRGERLYFRVNSIANGAFDQVSWAPVITYTQLTSGTLDLNQTDANNLPEYRYTAASEFTMAGKGMATKAPLTGTLHLGGQLVKSAATSDNVSLVLLKNGAEVYRQDFTDQQITTQGISQDLAVTQLDDLQWKLIVDSRIDVTKVAFSPAAWYTAAQGVPTVTDENGAYVLTLNIPSDIDLYPVNSRTSAIAAYIVPAAAPDTRSMLVAATMTFANLDVNETHSGVLVVKKRTGLLVKQAFTIVGTGAPTQDFPVLVSATVTTGDELFFEIDSRDAKFSEKLTQVNTVIGSATVTAAVNQRAIDGLFGQNFRGWYYFGYNGSSPRDIAPIDQSLLVLTTNTDPNTLKVYAYSAEPAIAGGRWGIMDNRGWISPSAISSTRIGIDDVRMPTGSQFAGAGAPARMSQSKNTALGVLASGSTGSSKSLIDFQDLNGDRFPDVIGENGVQYTAASGGLEPGQRPSLTGGSRRGTSTGTNFSLSSSMFASSANAKGQQAPSGVSSAPAGTQGSASSPLGFGGSLGTGSSTTEMDLMDVNGDGLPDKVYPDGGVELNLGYSFAAKEFWNSGAVSNGTTDNQGINLGFNIFYDSLSGGVSLSKGKTTSSEVFVDINGDGLPDKVIGGGSLYVRLNTGSGYTGAFVWPGGHTSVAVDNHISLGGGSNVTFAVPCCAIIPVVKFAFNTGIDISTSMGRPEVMFRDMDGDGFADHVNSTRDSELLVASNPIGRTNLLKKVDRPMGANFTISYVRSGNSYELPNARWNMNQVTVFDGHAGEGVDTQITNYDYAEPHYDRLERDFFGYRSVSEMQLDTAAGNIPYRQTLRSYTTDNFYAKGLMRFEQVRNASGALFTETENTYVLFDVDNNTTLSIPLYAGTVFPRLTRTDKRFFEGTGSAQKTTYTTHEYDALGNITRFTDSGDSGAADDIDATITYSNCQPYYIIEPITITVYGGGSVVRRRESVLDCASGNVTQVKQYVDAANAAVTDLTYEANGNLKEVIGAGNKSGQRYKLTYAYDALTQSQVTQITDSFGLTSTADYDFYWAKPTTTTDTNGQQTTYVYDNAGRPVSLVGPYEQGLGQTTISFEYHPEVAVPYAVTRHIDKDAAGNTKGTATIDTILFIDGLKRVLQTKKDAAVHSTPSEQAKDLMVVTGQVVFDAFGRTVAQYYPVTENKGGNNNNYNTDFDSVAPTRTVYDVLDRSTQTTLPDNTVTTSAYGFGYDRQGLTQFETRVTDALGKVKFSYRDVKGLITSIKEKNGAQEIQTSYRYDALKQITEVIDDKLNTTLVAYDNLGRRTRIDNPDAGITDSVYDLAGNLIQKITNNLRVQNAAIEYDYDFNRLIKIRYPIFTQNNVTYTYGAPNLAGNNKGNRAGRVTMVTDASGIEERFYGPLGETIKEIKTIPASLTMGAGQQTYTTEYTFDTWNRMMRMVYPDGPALATSETLTYSYDSGGLVAAASGKKGSDNYGYLARLEYDKFGQRAYMELGNGVKTSYTYRADNRRLDNLRSQLPQPSQYVFQNINYTYDAVGNITQMMNDVIIPANLTGNDKNIGNRVGGPSNQIFTYDDLYRLTSATGGYQNKDNQTNRYTVTMQYDSIHNITRKQQVNDIANLGGNAHTIGATTYDFAYHYISPKPHAASDTGPYDHLYDGNGNLTRRENRDNNQVRQLIWDEENRLACTQENKPGYLPQTPASCVPSGSGNEGFYVYNAAGTRIFKDNGVRSFAINQNYTEKGPNRFKHVFVGNHRLLTKRVENSNKLEVLQWFSHGDHLGSTGYTTNATGQLQEYIGYTPHGEQIVREHPSQPVDYAFTNKEFDSETGYYYFGARYYDPRVSTWVSPDDRISGAELSKGLSLYMYVSGNPVLYNDPDGHEAYLGSRPISSIPPLSYFEHAFVYIVVDSPNKYGEHHASKFRPYTNRQTGQRSYVATLSGQPDGFLPNLEKTTENAGDRALMFEYFATGQQPANLRTNNEAMRDSQGRTDTVDRNLLETFDSYRNNSATYHPVPDNKRVFNSNSFARTLVEKSGATSGVSLPSSVRNPGMGTKSPGSRLPERSFGGGARTNYPPRLIVSSTPVA